MKNICTQEADMLYKRFRTIKRSILKNANNSLKVIGTGSVSDIYKICNIYGTLLSIEQDFYSYFMRLEVIAPQSDKANNADDFAIAKIFAARFPCSCKKSDG